MDKREIEIGKEYAVREPVARGVTFQRVKVLEHVRAGQWRVEWIDPNPGLIDYVKSRNVIVRWRDRHVFVRDEENEQKLIAALEASGYPGDGHPLANAVVQILESAGESDLSLYRGVLSYDDEALDRCAVRAGIDRPTHAVGYMDRHGQSYLPFESALVLAEALAQREPRTVLDEIDSVERDWGRQLRSESRSGISRLLAEYRASWAIIRQWAGHDEAVAFREERILELERFLSELRWDLRLPNPDVERLAGRIEQILR